MPAGEAEMFWARPACLLEDVLRDAPGKLLLVLQGQVSASGLFLFLKNTDNIFLPLCSDMTMYVHKAFPYPSKGGGRSRLAHRAMGMRTAGHTSPSHGVALG